VPTTIHHCSALEAELIQRNGKYGKAICGRKKVWVRNVFLKNKYIFHIPNLPSFEGSQKVY
jgi:hypothetical protein